MNLDTACEAIWQALNSPIGISIVGGVMVWLLARLFTAKPAWAKWQGTIITAVRTAEKLVPDDTPSAGLKRLDQAMQYVLKVFEEVQGRQATAAESAALKEGVQITHTELEAAGSLAPPATDPDAILKLAQAQAILDGTCASAAPATLVPAIPPTYPAAPGRVSLACLLAIVAAGVLLLAAGGCGGSQSIDGWTDRGIQGVEIERKNVEGLYGTLFKANNQNRLRSVDAAYMDLADRFSDVAAGRKPSPTTASAEATSQPADPNSVNPRVPWLATSKAILLARLKAADDAREELQARREIHMAGLDGLSESFQQVRRVNRSWMTANEQVTATLQALTAEVAKLRSERTQVAK
jgi:hypothetical protein